MLGMRSMPDATMGGRRGGRRSRRRARPSPSPLRTASATSPSGRGTRKRQEWRETARRAGRSRLRETTFVTQLDRRADPVSPPTYERIRLERRGWDRAGEVEAGILMTVAPGVDTFVQPGGLRQPSGASAGEAPHPATTCECRRDQPIGLRSGARDLASDPRNAA